ncbi:MAG: hypothetical protein KAJ12_03460 [Bacteroidetes bacterium]|nr:hypothetical protein [Bacteroidota bacterium]
MNSALIVSYSVWGVGTLIPELVDNFIFYNVMKVVYNQEGPVRKILSEMAS